MENQRSRMMEVFHLSGWVRKSDMVNVHHGGLAA